jgi:Tol biopolymer transport system component
MTRTKRPITPTWALTLLVASVCGIVYPAWGQEQTRSRIFFLRHEGVGTELSLVAVGPDGNGVTVLTKNLKPEDQPISLAVSPDGKQVAYGVRVPDETSANHEIVLKTVGDEKPAERLNMQGIVWCWSPDGRSLAVTTVKDNLCTHRIFDLKTRKAKALQLPEVKAPESTDGPVGHMITDWSKDGKWFLTTVQVDEVQTDLYRVTSDGSEAKKIGKGLCGKFSPDGKKVLYLGWKEKESPDKGRLFVADVEKGESRQVSQELNGQFTGGYCWSPDGKKIAYVWQGDRAEGSMELETFLMVMDVDGKDARAIRSEKLTSPQNYVLILCPDWR